MPPVGPSPCISQPRDGPLVTFARGVSADGEAGCCLVLKLAENRHGNHQLGVCSDQRGEHRAQHRSGTFAVRSRRKAEHGLLEAGLTCAVQAHHLFIGQAVGAAGLLPLAAQTLADLTLGVS